MSGRGLENQVGLHRRQQPCALRKLDVELAGAPARIAHHHPHAGVGRGLERPPHERRRGRQIDALHHFERLGIEIVLRGQNPRARRLDRAAGVEMHLRMDVERVVGGDDRLRRLVHAAVDDQAERAVRAVLGQQHDGLREVGIEHLRHRHQQDRGERGVRHAFDTISLQPGAASAARCRSSRTCWGSARRPARRGVEADFDRLLRRTVGHRLAFVKPQSRS